MLPSNVYRYDGQTIKRLGSLAKSSRKSKSNKTKRKMDGEIRIEVFKVKK